MQALPLRVSVFALALATPVLAQVGWVQETRKISNSQGGFGGTLLERDAFGVGVTALGDLDGDGVGDLAVSARGAGTQGVLWILFMAPDFTVQSESMVLASGENCGDVVNVGDLDGDGLAELALVSDPYGARALDVLFLRADGSLRLRQRTLPGDALFVPPINGDFADNFGVDLAPLGDVDGDGLGDLAVGASGDDDGDGRDNGAIWIVYLAGDGRPKAAKKISMRHGGGEGRLDVNGLGRSIASFGDMDGDGNIELAARVMGDWLMPTDRVASELLLLYLDADEDVRAVRTLPQQVFGFVGNGAGRNLEVGFSYGASVALGDLDGDGTLEVALGVPAWTESVDTHAQFTPYQGAVLVASLLPSGSVVRTRLISRARGGFDAPFYDFSEFGLALALVPDLDADGTPELLVGSPSDSDFANFAGSVWLLDLDTSAERNGTGLNPRTLTQSAEPQLGRLWKTTLDCSGHAPGLAILGAFTRPHPGLLTPAGEALVDPSSRLFLHARPHSGTPVTRWTAIPPDPALLGRLLHVQALCTGAPGPQLSNALDVIVGR